MSEKAIFFRRFFTGRRIVSAEACLGPALWIQRLAVLEFWIQRLAGRALTVRLTVS